MDTVLMVRYVGKCTGFRHKLGLWGNLFYRKNKYLQGLLSICLALMH